LAFDLRRSDLPLQVAFPLLLANLTAWLAPSGGSDVPAQVGPGAPVSFSLAPDVQEVRLTRPDGGQSVLEATGGQVVVPETDRTGIYVVRWGENGQAAFAVNLFATGESDLAPAGGLVLAGGAGEPNVGQAQDTERGARREWWRPLAWVALLALCVEWLVYYRATLARLWGKVRAVVSAALPRG
jgi:hypothetical protein